MSALSFSRLSSTPPQASGPSQDTGLLQRSCACGASRSPLADSCDHCKAQVLQRKLAVGTRNDPLEAEADQIADTVLASWGNAVANQVAPRIQRASIDALPQQQEVPDSVGRTLAGTGSPLEPVLRRDMEQRLGHDFSRVRVHSDRAANASAKAVRARAYAAGNDIVFGAAQFAPDTTSGRRMLAHELVHVVQQSGLAGTVAAQSTDQPGSAGFLQRKPSTDVDVGEASAPSAPAPEKFTEVDYAFVFTGGAYGEAAESFIKRYYKHHQLIRASSFEEMFDLLLVDMNKREAKGQSLHLRELIIVTHANAAGGLKIPLTRQDNARHRLFTSWDVDDLQQKFRAGLHQQFKSRRHEVVMGMIDDETRVIVRGCQFGQADEAMDALRALFGGQPTVYAPRVFQGYEGGLEIGKSFMHTPEEAFDFLVQQDFLPEEMRPAPDEDKKKYIARVFGLHGTIPAEFFLVGQEDHDRLLKMDRRTAVSDEAEPLKHRDQTERLEKGDVWNTSSNLSTLSLRKLTIRAHELGNPYRPENACALIRVRAAWENRQLELPASREFFMSPAATSSPLGAFSTTAFMQFLLERYKDSPATNPLDSLPVEELFPIGDTLKLDALNSNCEGHHADTFETDNVFVNVGADEEKQRKQAAKFVDPPALRTTQRPPPRRIPGLTTRSEDKTFLDVMREFMLGGFWTKPSEGGFSVNDVIVVHAHRKADKGNSFVAQINRIADPVQKSAAEAVFRTAALIGDESNPVPYWNEHAGQVLGAIRNASLITNEWDVDEFFREVSTQIVDMGVDAMFEAAGVQSQQSGITDTGDALYQVELATLQEALIHIRKTGAIQLSEAKKTESAKSEKPKSSVTVDKLVKNTAKFGAKTAKAPPGTGLKAADIQKFADKAVTSGAPGAEILEASADAQYRREELGAKLQTIDRVLGIMQGPSKWAEKLEKLRHIDGNHWRYAVTFAQVVQATTTLARDALWLITDVGARLEMLAPAALRPMTIFKNLRDGKAFKYASAALAILDLALSVENLVEAIRDGNARREAEAVYGVTQSGIGLAAEFGGATAESVALPATGIAFLIWAEVDTLLMVGEIIRGFRKLRALDAAKAFISDAVKVAYYGRDLLAAAIVLQDTLLSADPVGLAAQQRATDMFNARHDYFRIGADILLVNHIGRKNDLDAIGAYESVRALGIQARDVLENWCLFGMQDPLSAEDQVRAVYKGIRAVAEDAAQRYKPDR